MPVSTVDTMEAPLFAIAEADIDIVPALFARFFATFPEHRAAFINLDAAATRMTNETIEAMIGLAAEASNRISQNVSRPFFLLREFDVSAYR